MQGTSPPASRKNFEGTDLTEQPLDKDLAGAQLDGSHGKNVSFSYHNLEAASLRGAKVPHSSFHAANLIKADCEGADLSWCNFFAADVAHANFKGADLSYTDFTSCRNFDTTEFDSKTKMWSAKLAQVECYGKNFEGAEMPTCDFEGAIMVSAFFNDAIIADSQFLGTDISGAQFDGADASGCRFVMTRNLAEANFEGVRTLEAARFVLVRAPGLDLGDTMLKGARFAGADLSGARFQAANLQNVVFKNDGKVKGETVARPTLLTGARFDNAIMDGSEFHGVEMAGAGFAGAVLTASRFHASTLSGADLSGATACNADFKGCDMRGAMLTGAVLRGADLRGASLEGAVLTGADLTGADLRGTNLKGAILKGVISLRGARIDGATTLHGTQFDGANLDGAVLDGVVATECNFTGARFDDARATFARFARCDFTKADLGAGDGLCAIGATFQGCEWGERKKKELADWPAAERDWQVAAALKQAPKIAATVAVAAAVAGAEVAAHAWVAPLAKAAVSSAASPAVTAWLAQHSTAATVCAFLTAKYVGVTGAVHALIKHVPFFGDAADWVKEHLEDVADKAKDWVIDQLGERLEEADKARFRGQRVGVLIRAAANAFADHFAMDGDGRKKRYMAWVCLLRSDRKAYRAAIASVAHGNTELRKFGAFATEIGHIVICHRRAAIQAHRLMHEAAASRMHDLAFARKPNDDPQAPLVVSVLGDGSTEATWFQDGRIALKVRWAPDGTPIEAANRVAGGWFERADMTTLPDRNAAFAGFKAAASLGAAGR